ncbi:hypothetical protein BO99DRAFT_167934 [Aspergillus violaceofuscus CBS 115571]|uniref:Uncharacterized protein n=1 Tax=Aspergillus violaceofuscus (strain CBS 115571) TaxID=1450538 RepID=A0A2V5H319_ASPV1|nr:hypothetical protein BO99DRAFT_167934 [Aspergillus violaceofuscus CBS 115571]
MYSTGQPKLSLSSLHRNHPPAPNLQLCVPNHRSPRGWIQHIPHPHPDGLTQPPLRPIPVRPPLPRHHHIVHHHPARRQHLTEPDLPLHHRGRPALHLELIRRQTRPRGDDLTRRGGFS